jgi:type II secretory pathway component GspD/PulD (secretin)
MPAVIGLSIVPAARAAPLLRSLYPHAVIRLDDAANALIVVAPPDDLTAMRAIVSGIDVKNPAAVSVDAIQLRTARPAELAVKLKPLFSRARLVAGPNATLIVAADPQELAQIHAVVASLDVSPPSPPPRPVYPATVVRVTQGDPRLVARAAARAVPNLAISVAGTSLLLRGTPDDVAQGKTVIAQLDQPAPGTRYTQVYRLTSIDAGSLAALISRSFPDAAVQVDQDLNAMTVLSTMHMQQRIADAIAQLDVQPGGSPQGGSPGQSFVPGSQSEVVSLRAAVPGPNGAPSTSTADIAQTVTQALGASASDLHITLFPNSTKLVLSGSAHSIGLAEALIAKLDVAEPLVELDTEVLEVDESVQKQLGFKFPTPLLSTTYSEIAPITASGSTAQLGRLQALTRTPLSLQAELDFLVSTNKARILEDPRITTFSGRTASLRAGETVNILTTAGGGAGTVATTQVQSFQTGVTLDITPVVNADDYVTVTLHPSVNSETGVSAAGVPNIQNRDTTTTIGLHDGETIVIGGLIEDTDSRSVQKIPILGDLPLIGRLFQDVGVTHTRNELIVTVTPHILKPGMTQASFGPPLPAIPTPEPLPTLEPSATLPPDRSQTALPSPLPTSTQRSNT